MKSLASYPLILALATLTTAHDGPHSVDDPAGNTHNDLQTAIITTIQTAPTGPPPNPTAQTGCPTVTATRELCTTCPIPLCLGLATVTQSCGCPSTIPTVYLDFPCSESCKGVLCSTSYDIVTATEKCDGPKPTGGPGFGNGTTTTTLTPSLTMTLPTGSISTSSAVTVNRAGRMAIPGAGLLGLMAGWF